MYEYYSQLLWLNFKLFEKSHVIYINVYIKIIYILVFIDKHVLNIYYRLNNTVLYFNLCFYFDCLKKKTFIISVHYSEYIK